MYQYVVQSPVGPLTLEGTETALLALRFGALGQDSVSPVLELAARQLAEYFAGERRVFTVPLSPAGTPFQKGVWEALQSIPYGETSTYGAVAQRIGNPKACRAVGMANNRNPLPIFIPCHRVVGRGGSLTGYAGGLDRKQFLLDLERGKR